MLTSKDAFSPAEATKLHDRTRLGSRRARENLADAPSTAVEWCQVRILPAHLPAVVASTSWTARKEARGVPSARIRPACQRDRFGSSRSPKKRSVVTLGSQA